MNAGFEPDPDCPYDYAPDCTGVYIDVDYVDDRGCELHDPNSHWNRWRRAWDAAHEDKPADLRPWQQTLGVISDDDCPF